MTAVQKLLDMLSANHIPADFENTGGGCYAVKVRTADGGEILVTDSEDVFSHGDLTSDENVSGFYVCHYGPDGAPSNVAEDEGDGATLYLTPEGTPLGSDIAEVGQAVAKARLFVLAALFGGGFHPDTPFGDYNSVPEGVTYDDWAWIIQNAHDFSVDVYGVALDAAHAAEVK